MNTAFRFLFAIISILFILSTIKVVSDRSTITDIQNELKLKTDSLTDLRSGSYSDAREVGLLSVDSTSLFRLGDTLNFNVFMMAYNTQAVTKPYVVLYKNVNPFSRPYDTIDINSVTARVRFKTYKVGANTFGGIYFYPNKGKYLQYPFTAEYMVMDSLKAKRKK